MTNRDLSLVLAILNTVAGILVIKIVPIMGIVNFALAGRLFYLYNKHKE